MYQRSTVACIVYIHLGCLRLCASYVCVTVHRTIQEPGSQILTWYKPAQSILVIKKLWDDSVEKSFVELATWLVKVTYQYKCLDVIKRKLVHY